MAAIASMRYRISRISHTGWLMRAVLVSVSVLALAACGPLIEEGKYDVTIRLESDTCQLGADDVSKTEWELSEDDGDWEIEYEEGDTISGEEGDGSLEFNDTESDYDPDADCNINTSITIEIEPDDDGFSGDGHIAMAMDCADDSTDTCAVLFDIDGELDD